MHIFNVYCLLLYVYIYIYIMYIACYAFLLYNRTQVSFRTFRRLTILVYEFQDLLEIDRNFMICFMNVMLLFV